MPLPGLMPPPMAGGMPPGVGPPPGMPPSGPPHGAMAALGDLQDAPQGSGETEALGAAASQIGMALARAWMRSPKAATKLSKALTLVNQAREDLEQAGTQPPGMVPDLGGGGASPMPMGRPGGPGM